MTTAPIDVPEPVRPFRRTALKPVVREGDSPPNASKFAGIPWLAEGEEWPACGNCEEPMQLFVQLTLDRLPGEVAGHYGSGLLQMFYCTNDDQMCDSECDAWAPFSKSTLVRVVHPGEETRNAGIEKSPVRGAFPAKTIVAWEAMEDYPNTDELERLGVELNGGEKTVMWDSETPHVGDKLAGWPFWVQGVEYPNCPTCGKEMRLVFQIDSEDNLPYMFGDAGVGHITQCPEHLDVVAFGWACG